MQGLKSDWEPKPIPGARALLFERLVDNEPECQQEAKPLRSYNVEALKESVRQEVARLLNTRRPHSEEPQDGEALTVLDYGIPSFSHLSAASDADRKRLAAILVRALSAFEPRLSQVDVTFEQAPGSKTSLVGNIKAILEIGSVRETVSFPIVVEAKTGETTVLEWNE